MKSWKALLLIVVVVCVAARGEMPPEPLGVPSVQFPLGGTPGSHQPQQMQQWPGTSPTLAPRPIAQAAPASCSAQDLPVPTVEALRELADMVASSVHFHTGTSQLAAEALGRYAAQARYAPAVTGALLTALDRAGGVDGIGDRGELMRMLGVTAAFLPENNPLFQRAEGELRRAMSLAAAGSKFRDAVLNPDSDHPAAQMVRSAAAGWEALALAGKVKGPQMEFLADIPVPEAANALATAMDAATSEERKDALARFFKQAAEPAFSRMRGLALRAMAKYVDKSTAGQLATALDRTIADYQKDPKSFDPSALGVLQVVEKTAAIPEVQAVARAALMKYALHGEAGKRRVEALVAHARAQMAKDTEAAKDELEKIDKDIVVIGAEVLLDIAGTVDPTPVCDGLACALAIRRGDYLSATLSAVAMLPYVGDGIVKPLKLGGAAARVMRLAARAERVLMRLSKSQQRLEQLRALADYSVDSLDGLTRGEMPAADDSLALLARMTLGRKRLNALSGTLRTIQSFRGDVEAIQDGTCPSRVAKLVGSLQRGLRRPIDWFQQKLPDPTSIFRARDAARPFVIRGAAPDEMGMLTPKDLGDFTERRKREMRLTVDQRKWVDARIAQMPGASYHDIVDILLQAKYPN